MFLITLRIGFTALLMCITSAALCQFQSVDIDSLKNALAKEKTDSATLTQYTQKVNTDFGFTNLQPRLVIFNWILKNSKRNKQWYLVADTYYMIGLAYLDNDDFVKGSKNLMLALKYSEKYKLYKIRAKTWSVLASVYYYNRQYTQAKNYLKKSIDYAVRTGARKTVFNGYHNLGLIYFSTSANNKILRDSALHFLRLASTFLDSTTDTLDVIAFNTNISGFFSEMGMYDSALFYLNKTLPIIEQSKRIDHYILYYHKLGKTFREMGRLNEAIKNYKIGLEYAKQSKSASWTYSYYFELSLAYELTGNYKQAFSYYQDYHSIRDSIVNKENFAQAVDIQNKYEREKNERLILQLNKNNEIKRLKIEKESQFRKKIYIIIAGVTLMGMSLIILVLYQVKMLREKREAYHSLQQKNIDILQQSGHLAYQARLIARYQSQMNPHFIFNAVNNIQGLVLTGNKDKSLAQLENFKLLMQQTLEHSEKDYITLSQEASYLQQYVAFEKARFIKPFEFSIHLPPEADRLLLPPMIIQPFIENAIKHAGLHAIDNSFIRVHISVETLLHISITDNGRGFDMKKSNVLKKGHALDIIRSRIRLFFESENITMPENFFSVNSVEGSGTTIQLVSPLRYA